MHSGDSCWPGTEGSGQARRCGVQDRGLDVSVLRWAFPRGQSGEGRCWLQAQGCRALLRDLAVAPGPEPREADCTSGPRRRGPHAGPTSPGHPPAVSSSCHPRSRTQAPYAVRTSPRWPPPDQFLPCLSALDGRVPECAGVCRPLLHVPRNPGFLPPSRGTPEPWLALSPSHLDPYPQSHLQVPGRGLLSPAPAQLLTVPYRALLLPGQIRCPPESWYLCRSPGSQWLPPVWRCLSPSPAVL